MKKRFQLISKKNVVLAFISILITISSACLPKTELAQEEEPQQMQKITLSADSLKTALSKAKDQWQAQDIAHYRIQVRHVSSVWHLQTYEIEVKNGEITHSATCIPAPVEGRECEVEDYDPADYTVEGLFEMAGWMLDSQVSEYAKMEFDEDYGYPKLIAYDHPEILDEDNVIAVLEFEIIEAGNG